MLSLLAVSACGLVSPPPAPTPEEALAAALALVPADPRAAAERLAGLCDGGLVAACDAAGGLTIDDERRPTWNERACEGGIAAACVRRSEQPGDTFAQRACEAGHGPACLPAADAVRAAGDTERAAALYAAGCRVDPDGVACLLAERVGRADPPGEAPPWPQGDAAAVSAALWARCAANEAWGCLQLAEHVERHGGPLPADARGDAAWLRNQACDLQLTYACAPHAW